MVEAVRHLKQHEAIDAVSRNRHVLLEYFHHFVLFQQGKGLNKIIAQYHQFQGVRAAVASTVEASRPEGDKKGGIFWHTQGSGKSLSADFYPGILMEHPATRNPTIVLVTDRNDRDGQLVTISCPTNSSRTCARCRSATLLLNYLNVCSRTTSSCGARPTPCNGSL